MIQVVLRSLFIIWKPSGNVTENSLLLRKAHYWLLAVTLLASVLALSLMAQAADSEIDHLIQVLDLKPGVSVADVGAGSGEFSMLIAKRVAPNGTVYSTEIDPKNLDKIRQAGQKAGIHNVVVIAGANNDTRLPSNCCDAIFLRRVYHHLTDPVDMDRSLFLAMRPGGRLAIIDFEPSQRPGESPPPGVPANRGGHGAPKTIVTKELTQAGFVPVATIDWPVSGDVKHFCMLFKKPMPPASVTALPPP
jgi:SAM-dependent methyltransferase